MELQTLYLILFKKNLDEKNKFRAKNTQILHCLQTSLKNASWSDFNIFPNSIFLPLYHVFISKTYVLFQLRQFWNLLRIELTNESLYQTNIGNVRLRLQELQKIDSKSQKQRQEWLKSY